MSKSLDTASTLTKAKSWADVDNDDFWAQAAQDKAPAKTSPTSAFGARPPVEKPHEKKSASAGGIPWSFPNPVQPQGQQQQSRFESLQPATRRGGNLGSWRR